MINISALEMASPENRQCANIGARAFPVAIYDFVCLLFVYLIHKSTFRKRYAISQEKHN